MLVIPRLDLPPDPAHPAGQKALRHHGAALEVACANWPEFGRLAGQPIVNAWMAHTGSLLHLLFEVAELDCRAVNNHDQDPVWQDSCVELFIKPDRAPTGYYNFEFNCIGRCLSAFGPDRHQRSPTAAIALSSIIRSAHPWSTAFGLKTGQQQWQLAVCIPATILLHHGIRSWAGHNMRLNLYKCGDALPRPHYLSLYPINSHKPDFHRPECFGPVHFME